MLGLFTRRPAPALEVTARLKSWIAAVMHLGEGDTIMLAELRCRDPGCPDFETVATVVLSDRRQLILRFPDAIAEVTEAQVQSLSHLAPRRRALPDG